MKINRALISVSNKENIIPLAKALVEHGVEIISTGGTAKALLENNIKVTPIEEVTGNPEAFGGRMKTLSFQIESALLYRRANEQDLVDAKKLNIQPIDLVVCNLYPFKEISKNTKKMDDLIENIDIGGPTMIRAAAKNHKDVVVLTNPSQYENFTANLKSGNLNSKLSLDYALDAFKMTAHYDQFIFNTLNQVQEIDAPPFAFEDLEQLRYGENPHQKAWLAKWNNTRTDISIANAQQIHGKQLSYNNLVDADAAWKCTSELALVYKDQFITTVVKHANPCGVAIGSNALTSLNKAWACDPISSFGSILSFNQEIGPEIANWLSDKFIEIIIAPSFSKKALIILEKKKNLRILICDNKPKMAYEKVLKSISGGILIQDEDELQNYEFLNVTKAEFPKEYHSLNNFGMIINKYLKSNSISLVAKQDEYLVLAGGGMGQPNRLDSLKMLAGPRALALGHNMNEVILISDAFFPFKDSIEVANNMGIKYIIQPGGSIRDEEVIQACDEFNMSMLFTKTRHFRH